MQGLGSRVQEQFRCGRHQHPSIVLSTNGEKANGCNRSWPRAIACTQHDERHPEGEDHDHQAGIDELRRSWNRPARDHESTVLVARDKGHVVGIRVGMTTTMIAGSLPSGLVERAQRAVGEWRSTSVRRRWPVRLTSGRSSTTWRRCSRRNLPRRVDRCPPRRRSLLTKHWRGRVLRHWEHPGEGAGRRHRPHHRVSGRRLGYGYDTALLRGPGVIFDGHRVGNHRWSQRSGRRLRSAGGRPSPHRWGDPPAGLEANQRRVGTARSCPIPARTRDATPGGEYGVASGGGRGRRLAGGLPLLRPPASRTCPSCP